MSFSVLLSNFVTVARKLRIDRHDQKVMDSRPMKFLALAILSTAISGVSSGASLININFSGDMTPLQQQTFLDAAEFWNSVIIGYDAEYDELGAVGTHSLTINASLPYIDGVGNVLGSAGWTSVQYFDNDPVTIFPTIALYYSTSGMMSFDSADADELIANNTFYSVVLHEMAHVLGFGTLWEGNTNVNNTGYNLYTVGSGQYFGPNALAQWRDEFNDPNASFVPVEMGGGEGTANGHWDEADHGSSLTGIVSKDTGMDLGSELMTGWSSESFFISRATLGAIDDLGYIVDYSKAGVIDHVVIVPEFSSIGLCIVSAGSLLSRRRRA